MDFSTSGNSFLLLVETFAEISWSQFFKKDDIITNENQFSG